MAQDVLITPATGAIEFKADGTTLAQIQLDTGNVFSITGNISLGDASADVYIGDGINNVDMIFEQSGSITGTTGVTITLGSSDSNVAVSPTLTVNTSNVATAITNGGGNGAGNIGSAAGYFNTVFAKATSAQYADVAEFYRADADYAIGTVLQFGGTSEVTQTTISHDPSVAGVVSSSPAVIMNSGLHHKHRVLVALLGRVPCRVQGPVSKGDRLVSSAIPGVAMRLDSTNYQPGCLIGKALEDCDAGQQKTIEVVVGRV